MNAIIPAQSLSLVTEDSIDEYRRLVMIRVSPTSQRVYNQTYDAWVDWCHAHTVDPMDFRQVMKFLSDHPDTLTTRRRKLSAMRTLVETASIVDNRYEPIYRLLKSAKAPKANLSKKERDRVALNPSQVQRILDAWNGDTNQSKRNRALLAIMFIAALRRSEIAALEWRDIDLANRVIHVRDGKGSKSGDVGLGGEFIIRSLKEWKSVCGERLYVFPRISKSGNILKDEPMSGDGVYAIVKDTEKLLGVPIKFAPHTGRRTYITEALTTGTPLADVMAQARHANEATTLRYARPVDASERGRKSKLRYGD